MPTPPLADISERRRGRRPAAASHTGRPRPHERTAGRADSIVLAEGISIPRLAGLILLVELVYVGTLAFAVPRGSSAVALAFATTFLLATVICRRVVEPTSTHQPITTNLKTREAQRRAPSVTRQRRTHGRREGSDAADPQGT
jgi:hypothetical protein